MSCPCQKKDENVKSCTLWTRGVPDRATWLTTISLLESINAATNPSCDHCALWQLSPCSKRWTDIYDIVGPQHLPAPHRPAFNILIGFWSVETELIILGTSPTDQTIYQLLSLWGFLACVVLVFTSVALGLEWHQPFQNWVKWSGHLINLSDRRKIEKGTCWHNASYIYKDVGCSYKNNWKKSKIYFACVDEDPIVIRRITILWQREISWQQCLTFLHNHGLKLQEVSLNNKQLYLESSSCAQGNLLCVWHPEIKRVDYRSWLMTNNHRINVKNLCKTTYNSQRSSK